MSARWLVPTLAYVVTLGALGVTSKLALRTMGWQDLVVWTAAAYAVGAIVLLVLGKGSFDTGPDVGWALLSAVIVVSSLVLLYIALGNEIGRAHV